MSSRASLKTYARGPSVPVGARKGTGTTKTSSRRQEALESPPRAKIIVFVFNSTIVAYTKRSGEAAETPSPPTLPIPSLVVGNVTNLRCVGNGSEGLCPAGAKKRIRIIFIYAKPLLWPLHCTH